jgi:hypothetical protein
MSRYKALHTNRERAQQARFREAAERRHSKRRTCVHHVLHVVRTRWPYVARR